MNGIIILVLFILIVALMTTHVRIVPNQELMLLKYWENILELGMWE